MSYRLLILNPGSTSTKAAVYDGDRQVAMKSIVHTNQDLAPYPTLYDQLDYRVALVRGWLGQEGIGLSTLSAVVGRGGIIPNIVAGGYVVDDNLVDCLRNYPCSTTPPTWAASWPVPLPSPWASPPTSMTR